MKFKKINSDAAKALGHNKKPSLAQPSQAGEGISVNIASPQTIEQSIQMALLKIQDESLKPVLETELRPHPYTRALVGLLAGFYYHHVYSSKVIAKKLAQDPGFTWPAGVDLPGAQDIQRFRTENREVIQDYLSVALHFTTEKYIFSVAVGKIESQKLIAEADRRIAMSIATDNQESSGECPGRHQAFVPPPTKHPFDTRPKE